MQKAQAAGRGLYGDTAGLQSLTAAQLKRVHISGRQGVHVPTLEEFLRYMPDLVSNMHVLAGYICVPITSCQCTITSSQVYISPAVSLPWEEQTCTD